LRMKIQMNIEELVGKTYTFDDGQLIEVVQIKGREVDGIHTLYITYQTSHPRGLPRKLVMSEKQFIAEYGHLFGYTNEYNQD